MAINISQGLFTVLDAATSAIRDNYAGVRTAINSEVSGYALPTLQTGGANVYVGDGRIPPQASSWWQISATLGEETLALNGGVSTGEVPLTIRCGVRHTEFSTDVLDVAPTVEDSGWRVAALMASAAKHLILKHVIDASGVYNVLYITTSARPFESPKPTSFEYDVSFRCFVRLRHSFDE